MSSFELISVVVTTYNRSDALLVVLRGLALQTDPNFEVIIADDGSSEDHRRLILESFEVKSLKVTYVWRPDVGFTLNRNRNCGVAASSGAYIVFLDGDCVPELDFIARHRYLAQPGFFVIGSRVLLSVELSQQAVLKGETLGGRSWVFWLKHRLFGHTNKLLALMRLPDWSRRVEASFRWKGIRGCNLAVWRADFEAINGFDESFVGWGHEDADFVLRLHNSGVKRKNGFCATEVYHLWHLESSRAQESTNANRVKERQQTHQVLSTVGYRESLGDADMVVNRLG